MIRNLEMRDLPHMFEWMKDKNVTENLQADFAGYTEDKAAEFIRNAMKQDFDSNNLHYAIVDENDEYMGTVSLKNINKKDRNAEYAIVTRSMAHGRGYARSGTEDILRLAFEKLGLEKVYLYVSTDNIGANRFYHKCGFTEEGVFRKHIAINGVLADIRWYSVLREEFEGREL